MSFNLANARPASGMIEEMRQTTAAFQAVRLALRQARPDIETELYKLEQTVIDQIRSLFLQSEAVAEANVRAVEILANQKELAEGLQAQNEELVRQNRRIEDGHSKLSRDLGALAEANVEAVFMMENSDSELVSLRDKHYDLVRLHTHMTKRARHLESESLALADANAEAVRLMGEREEALAELVERERKLRSANSRLREQAFVDALTGLFNHRYFREQIGFEVARAERYERALSLLFVDADHFKRINDEHGHQTGDRVLQRLSRIIDSEFRAADVAVRLDGAPLAARYGGEEFVVILPETDIAGARIAAERLRARVARTEFTDAAGSPLKQVTVSVGIAARRKGEGIDGLVARADAAVYRAKAEGRNRVATPPAESSLMPA